MTKKVPVLSTQSDYWFIRTDGGSYFQEFVDSGYIGINWNEITLYDLESLSEEALKDKIAKAYKLDPFETRGKTAISQIHNKLIRFRDLKKDDFVILPSAGSYFLAFGQIVDSRIYTESDPRGDCPYYKRRKIRILEVKELRELDPKFYEVKTNRHSISSINQYQDYIDRVTQVFYFKNDFGHLVFDVKQDEDIPLEPLIELIQTLQSVMKAANQHFSLGEHPEQNIIKLNLQSKGAFTIKVPEGTSLFITALALTLASCGGTDNTKLSQAQITKKELESFQQSKKKELAKIDSLMNILKVDDKKIHEQFK